MYRLILVAHVVRLHMQTAISSNIDGVAAYSVDPDLPLPEEHFRKLGIGSRATFFRWGKSGLVVRKIGGRRFVTTRDLTEFLSRQGCQCAGGPTL